MALIKKLFHKPITVKLRVDSSNGFHLRPIAKFASVAKKYLCDIIIVHKDKSVNAKSVSDILSLALEEKDSFQLICTGRDATKAIQALQNIFNTFSKEIQNTNNITEEDNIYGSQLFTKGEIIYQGIAISPLYIYKEEEKLPKKLLDFKQACKKAINELDDKGKQSADMNADIFMAQKELLLSTCKIVNGLDTLKQYISIQCKTLRSSMLSSKRSDYNDILNLVKKHMGIEVIVNYPKKDFILFADDLLPSQIDILKKTKVKAVVLKNTRLNSHTSILLRDAGICALISDISRIKEKTEIIIDSYIGIVLYDISKETIEIANKRLKKKAQEAILGYESRFDKAITLGNKQINILANVTDVDSAQLSLEEGAEGIGLFRTEFLFKKEQPSFEIQVEAYSKVFDIFENTSIRTLDVGGDKILPYINIPEESNPFLGIRGVRLFQTHPDIMKRQILAILVAAKNRPIKIIFPMISTVEEFIAAKQLTIDIAKENDIEIDKISFGIMIEVPSVLFLIKPLNKVVDFYSIGTNDLNQYLFATDRTHDTLKVDELSSVIFDAIKSVIKQSTKPISICGELASNKNAISKLLELGIDSLSISSKSIAQIKEIIRNSNIDL